jgi:hypothetical protein
MSTLFARAYAVIPIVAAASLVGKEGYFYKLDNAGKAVLCAATTDVPHGLILSVTTNGLEISAAPLGGNHGPVKVKLGANVTDLRQNLTLRADATAEQDDGTGPRVIVARPLELGSTGEEIECVLLAAKIIPLSVDTLTALAFTAGGATGPEVAALRDALKTILQNQGLML